MMKMKCLSILVGLFGGLVLFAQSPTYPPNTEAWRKVFSDEFNAEKLDRGIWKAEHNSFNNSGNTKRDSTSFALIGGDLRIYIRKAEDENNPKLKWTCGYIYTKETFGRNVYFEARMKTQKVSGVNNAFWLVTRDNLATSYSNRYEIDINEIQYDVVKQQNAAHLAWHDWKTYQYAADVDGNPVDNALGAMEYYDSDDYQIWGFWLKDNEFHFYLNGREIWNGIDHKTHKQQWQTGVGKIYPWAIQEEQRAYGKYRQDDWHYLGGYTGEMLHVAFSNMIMAADWTPETDDADGTFMSVDWVRVYEPEKEYNTIPKQEIAEESLKIISGDVAYKDNKVTLGKKGKIKVSLQEPISFVDDATKYCSYHVSNPNKGLYRISLLDTSNKVVGHFSSTPDEQLVLNLQGNRTSSATVYPHAFYSGGKIISSDYFVVNRFTTHTGVNAFDGDSWSVNVIKDGDEIPRKEPYFYPNIDETGETSFNNQWMLNAKKILSAVVTSIEIENLSEEQIVISDFQFGDNYLSVVSKQTERPFAKILSSSVLKGTVADTIDILVKSSESLHRIGLSENGIVRYLDNIPSGIYKVLMSPKETTSYQLVSIESGDNQGYVSNDSIKIFVSSDNYITKYPTYDTYIQENRADYDFASTVDFYLKSDRQYVREAFFEFDISDIDSKIIDAGVFFYLNNISPIENVTVGIFALDDVFKQPLYWSERPSWVKRELIGEFYLNSSYSKYYGDNISDYVNERIKQGKDKIYLQLVITSGSSNVLARFYQYNASKLSISPKLIISQKKAEKVEISTNLIEPSFDTFVAQQGVGVQAGSGNRENYFWVKNSKAVGWGREAFIQFELDADALKNISSAKLKLHLNELASADRYIFLATSGLPSNPDISNLVWNDLETIDNVQELAIAAVDTTDVGNYISWDVKDFLCSQVEDKKSRATFKIDAVGGSIDALLKFDQGHDNKLNTQNSPILELVCMNGKMSGLDSTFDKPAISIYPNPTMGLLEVSNKDVNVEVFIFDNMGRLLLQTKENQINISEYSSGIYFVKIGDSCLKLIKK